MNSCLFVEYPKCTTCRKAGKWLDDQDVTYDDRHIVEQRPTEDELFDWIRRSGLPCRNFFNTSGLLYKSMGLKDKLPGMPLEEQVKLLASNGMLVKRPILLVNGHVCVGFKPDEWQKALQV